MATAAEDQLYPGSTNDGQAIPLDIIRPLGLSVNTVAAAGAILTLPAAVSLCVIYSSVDMILDLTGSPVSLVADYASALFIPASTLITATLPAVTSVTAMPLGTEDGLLSIQSIQKWAGLGTKRQLDRR